MATGPCSIIAILSRSKFSCFFCSLFLLLSLCVEAATAYKLHSFKAPPLSLPHRLPRQLSTTSEQSDRGSSVLKPWEIMGVGDLEGPETVIYNSKSRLIYTGCGDGWIKRVTLNESTADSVIEDWVNTGGRPLGLAFGHHGEVIVADPKKGLLNISRSGQVKVLMNETKLLDSVAMAKNGMVYFTEASYKYGLNDFMLDLMEGEPHGRLWSYNPSTKESKVLVRNLFFSNGLAVSPDQNFVVFCETLKKRCRKFYIEGKKKGRVNRFVDLPGLPDNIHYDESDGHYWISLAVTLGNSSKAGVVVVDKDGNATANYFGTEMSLISSSVRVGNYLFCGSFFNPYLIRLNLQEYHSFFTFLSPSNIFDHHP
ncbi:protein STRICTOSIDINE SYNTHASE-LIKE 5-like [Humulus lupulus]|uniref:protein STRICTOSIDINE SYNTHASE-LIKE 5-like n=1 Tax=Humulus lupulus TaxID=3486 RepID=UPI002B4151FA|nr:protein STRICTOSIDINE SYNTHASE-LIKE 5-like [Humulus lupulus]